MVGKSGAVNGGENNKKILADTFFISKFILDNNSYDNVGMLD